MDRTKLTYLISGFNTGGAQIGMLRLLTGLNPDEFQITLVTLKKADPDIVDKLPEYVTLYELNVKSKFEIYKVMSARNIISDTDILVCSLFHSIVVGSILYSVFMRSGKVYTWRHNTKSNTNFRKLLYKLSYKLSDGVFTDSEITKEQMVSWGINEARIFVLPLSGVNVVEYPSANHIRNDEKIQIGTVGRLVNEKGYPELIECAKRLSDYEFHVVGDGPLSGMLEESPGNIIWHGHMDQQELKQLYGEFDIYFQPSREEGLCITAIEAMASNLPVVASNVGGLTESVVNDETGYIVEQGNISGYCSQIEKLAADPELRNNFGNAGKNRVERKFSAEALASEFRKIVFNYGYTNSKN